MPPIIEHLKKVSKNIFWIGKVPNHKVAGYLQAADCLIMASKDEGMSNTLLEAMASGVCPIIPGHVSGAKDLIKNNSNGITYDFKNDKVLIKRLTLISKKDIAAMGTNARKRVQKLCNPNMVAVKHKRLYQQLISRKF